MIIFKKFTLIILLFITSFTAQALEVIRVNIDRNSSSQVPISQSVDIQLFDNVVLNTVTNFLSYVDDGSYNDLFINRSAKDFVIQTGGFTYDPTLNDGSFSITATDQFNGGLQPVTAKPDISNEFVLSNLRGTLAMAKKPNLPDSANSQWFINLVDNTFLDDSNGGFTVFGKVLGNGMDTIDTVAAIPAYNLAAQLDDNPAFTDMPLAGFDSNLTVQDITQNNLVFLRNFKHLFNISDTVDFSDAIAGATVQKEVVITNTGTTQLTTGAVDISTLSAPFSIVSNNCENINLAAGANCVITVMFSPLTSDYFVSSINVSIATYGYSFPVTLRTPASKIFVNPDDINFGAVPVYDPADGLPEQRVIRLTNKGDRDLHLSSITFSGLNADEFEFIDNCTTANNVNGANLVPVGEFCILVVNFKPNDLLEKHASIQIQSDDPSNKTLSINIVGGATDDDDGIPRAEEDSAPNNGDANNDGLPDGLQDNVASFINNSGAYSTLVTEPYIKLSQVTKLTAADFTELPAAVNFSNGPFSFQIAGITPGSGVKVGLILPPNQLQKRFYVYGPSSQITEPHWSALDNATVPAAVLYGTVSLSRPAGDSITVNISQLIVVDGGDGDSDSTANGVINFTGAVDISPPTDSSSGSLSIYWLLMAVFSTLLRENRGRNTILR